MQLHPGPPRLPQQQGAQGVDIDRPGPVDVCYLTDLLAEPGEITVYCCRIGVAGETVGFSVRVPRRKNFPIQLFADKVVTAAAQVKDVAVSVYQLLHQVEATGGEFGHAGLWPVVAKVFAGPGGGQRHGQELVDQQDALLPVLDRQVVGGGDAYDAGTAHYNLILLHFIYTCRVDPAKKYPAVSVRGIERSRVMS